MDQPPTSWARHVPSTELSERVLDAVADATDSAVRGVTPLYDLVDPDALDDLFAPTRTGARTATGSVVLRTDGCWVVARSDGRVDARPRTDPVTPPTRPTADSHRASHEWGGDHEITRAILRALDVSDHPGDDERRLFDAVDPDALDAIFAPVDGRTERDAGWLSFEFDGHTVTVDAAGPVTVTPSKGRQAVR